MMQVLYWEISIYSTPLAHRKSKKTLKQIDKKITNTHDGVGRNIFIGFHDKSVLTA